VLFVSLPKLIADPERRWSSAVVVAIQLAGVLTYLAFERRPKTSAS
jgi:hypothetical protein